jgi:hypothetical protein
MAQLGAVTVALVRDSFGAQSYGKALACVHAFRRLAIIVRTHAPVRERKHDAHMGIRGHKEIRYRDVGVSTHTHTHTHTHTQRQIQTD